MSLTPRWIKLGRLFMVAWLVFFIYPVAALLTTRFDRDAQVVGLALLFALAVIWGWFWLRVVAGPDQRFALPAVVAASALLVVFTLRTPPQYGSLFLYALIMAGAACNWRIGLPAVLLLSVLSGAVELARGEAEVKKLEADADLYRRKKAADGDLLVKLAEAQGTELENQALRGVGSENMVGLRMAEALKGTRLIVLPSDGEGGMNPLDLKTLMRRFDVKE